jgi:hypothetical protein
MPLKQSARAKTSASSKKPESSKTAKDSKSSTDSKISTGVPRGLGAGAIFLVVVGVVAAAMVMAARGSSEPANTAPPEVPEQVASMHAHATAPSPDVVRASNSAAATETPSVVKATAPVTLAGCVERSDETFRLKDTMGTAAPKSRSWKSGFLKKSPASIELIDDAHTLKLKTYAGHRVSVRGPLVDGQMHVWSVRQVAAACK